MNDLTDSKEDKYVCFTISKVSPQKTEKAINRVVKDILYFLKKYKSKNTAHDVRYHFETTPFKKGVSTHVHGMIKAPIAQNVWLPKERGYSIYVEPCRSYTVWNMYITKRSYDSDTIKSASLDLLHLVKTGQPINKDASSIAIVPFRKSDIVDDIADGIDSPCDFLDVPSPISLYDDEKIRNAPKLF